ncbi:MAG: capsid assembly protein [Alphaproteobacteria bacterium]
MNDENLLETEIPEKFKHPETGELQLASLLQSYKELERKQSAQPNTPQSPHDYCIECSHGMFEPDEDVNTRLHEHGFSQEQAQAAYDLAADKMVPMVREIAADYQAEREIEKLIEHFGGAQKWREVSRQLLSFGRNNMPEDVLDNLASSYEGVMALHRMMQVGEPKLSSNKSQAVDSTNEMELTSMMRDPRYWKHKDPSYIAKVTQGYQNLYGGKG